MKVTAGIFIENGKALLMRRGPNEPLAGKWEYPGGKFEPGEDGVQCIKRELFEELKIRADVGDLLCVAKMTTDSGKEIELHAYEIIGYSGDITMSVHDAMEWVCLSELVKHKQLPLDLQISKYLAETK